MQKATDPLPSVLRPTMAMNVDMAAAEADVGRDMIYKLIASGALPARKLGRRTIILRDDFQKFLKGLPPLELTSAE